MISIEASAERARLLGDAKAAGYCVSQDEDGTAYIYRRSKDPRAETVEAGVIIRPDGVGFDMRAYPEATPALTTVAEMRALLGI